MKSDLYFCSHNVYKTCYNLIESGHIQQINHKNANGFERKIGRPINLTNCDSINFSTVIFPKIHKLEKNQSKTKTCDLIAK